MGSANDANIMDECGKYLTWFGIESDTIVASAHRNPHKVVELTENAEKNGYSCIIGGAGMSAALPGVIAAHSALPVFGVPIASGMPNGMDALLSIAQMPPGLPVGCLAIGKAGARNAAILCARVIALNNKEVRSKLEEFKTMGYRL
ncbi:UNVERIFIED_CONTAM: hypothetical protein GTU68_004990 [Idotea baltica]|nr:hypothetical protein [Idotea baltica]